MHTTASVTIPMQMRPKSLSQIIIMLGWQEQIFPFFWIHFLCLLKTHLKVPPTLEVYLFRENAEDLTR